ncbi:MAG: bifunctional DNA primase/polymerase, partial [Chloroflexota bacterium]
MNLSNKLYNKAHFYRDLGYSVIPIWGNARAKRFKAAAVRWRGFQQTPPTDKDLDYWFLDRGFGGLAIVCGRVSQLAVLDFDDESLVALFAQLYPDLTETYTVRSGGRGMPHLYFHVPAHLHTRGRHLPGVDWQFDGAYVVAPPTSSTEGAWYVEKNISPKTLNANDLERIAAFLDAVPNPTTDSSPQASESDYVPVEYHSTQFDTISPDSVVRYYRERVGSGRNNALFKTCRWLRDSGATIQDAMLLVRVHTTQPALGTHMLETPEERREEALKTITSAFSRQPQPQTDKPLRVMPNALRELMLQRKQTATLRVLEAIAES